MGWSTWKHVQLFKDLATTYFEESNLTSDILIGGGGAGNDQITETKNIIYRVMKWTIRNVIFKVYFSVSEFPEKWN